ncbi:GtrA family protein [Nonomuraea sp. NPDC049141]|uniref:GtrA family protein n=1 Tax=unclassified Nonomuraea TaxID=2593643 RepID=UPI0033FCDA78
MTGTVLRDEAAGSQPAEGPVGGYDEQRVQVSHRAYSFVAWVRQALMPAGMARQLPAYLAIGFISTLAYLLLFAILSMVVSSITANATAMVLTTIASTAANRRFTFEMTSRAGAVRTHLESMLVLCVALAITTVSLDLLPSVTSPLAELATVILSNGLAGIVRFVLLRTWVFNPRRAS